MSTRTVTTDEDGRLEIHCQRERDAIANASLTSVEGETVFVIDDLEPEESVEIGFAGGEQ
jgi:hypothetical protein